MRIFLKVGIITLLIELSYSSLNLTQRKKDIPLEISFSPSHHFSIVIQPLSVIVTRLLKLSGGGS